MWGGAVVVAALVAGAEPYVAEVPIVAPAKAAADPAAVASTSRSPTPTQAATVTGTPTATTSTPTASPMPIPPPTATPIPTATVTAAPAAVASALGGQGLAPAPLGPPLADAAPVLIARRVAGDGGALERLVEPSGEIVLHAVNPAGTVLSCTPVGSLFTLRIVSEAEAAGGEVVEVVRDESGALLRFVVQPDGEPRAVALVEPGPGG